ncbi:MAG TPA: tRNA 2-thiouridine(34) synthase MnmA [bacterium]|nr:tRNA 2-thiouridine(34) synthase MnmA [bacterium]
MAKNNKKSTNIEAASGTVSGSIKQQKVFVGLSGGVDSSVTAALLVQAGYDVTGVFMQNWSADFAGCCNLAADTADARAVADQLNIPFYVWNFEAEYKAKVLDYFFAEYEAGRTPNPDVMCNREIKFKLFLDRALKLGADLVATGHYAQVIEDKGIFKLKKGIDPSKDQSYFLCRLGQHELSHALFPLGAMPKSEVRKLALDFKLPTATKKDSQGICFVGKIDIKEFLRTRIKQVPGEIINHDGEVLGEHVGLPFYTIGQREGIGNLAGGPYYVVDKNLSTNQLLVSSDPFDELLWRNGCIINDLSWVSQALELPAEVEVVIRYHHEPISATLKLDTAGEIIVNFADKQRAVTPGQLAVIFIGEELIGAGVIVKAI